MTDPGSEKITDSELEGSELSADEILELVGDIIADRAPKTLDDIDDNEELDLKDI
jgi:hypothetical protein